MCKSNYFNLGQIVMTKTIANDISENKLFAEDINTAMEKFIHKDWGDLGNADKQANDESLENPDDIFVLAAYNTCKGRVWIITNRATEKVGDNVTTICYPDEY